MAGGAAAAFLLPGVAELLIYDRLAVLDGELWRLVTGHLVHYSPWHLALNLLAAALAGGIIELRGYRGFPLLLVASALAISLSVLILLPEIAFYGGLSGLVSAEIVFLCCLGTSERGAWRLFCLLALAVFGGKIAWEVFSGSSLSTAMPGQTFIPLPMAHAVGALVGLLGACGVKRASFAIPRPGHREAIPDIRPETAPGWTNSRAKVIHDE